MRIIDADALMPLFMKKANTMKDRHGVKLGEEWLLNYNDIKDVIDNAPTVGSIPNKEKHICEDCIHNNVCEWAIFDYHSFVCDSFIDNGGIKL